LAPASSVKMALPRPSRQQVTQTVGLPIDKREDCKKYSIQAIPAYQFGFIFGEKKETE